MVKIGEFGQAHDYYAVHCKSDGQVAHYLVHAARLLKAAQCGQGILDLLLPAYGKSGKSIYPADKHLGHSQFPQMHHILRPTASCFEHAVSLDYAHIGGVEVQWPEVAYSSLFLKGVPDWQYTIGADILSLSVVDHRLPCAFSSLIERNNKNCTIPLPEGESAHKGHKGYSYRFFQCDIFSNMCRSVSLNSENGGSCNLCIAILLAQKEYI